MPQLEDTYHWALIIGPKDDSGESGKRYHAKEGVKPDGVIGWLFEEQEIPLTATRMLLIRVCIGKVNNGSKVESILRGVPIKGDVEGWNCVSWVMEALYLLSQDRGAMGTSKLEWKTVQPFVMRYAQSKKDQHRFDGKGGFDMSRAATFDLLEDVEKIVW